MISRSSVSTGLWPRLLATVWSLSAVVFVYVYVGTLVSFLSVPKLKPIIYRLEDLPNSKLKWSVTAGTALESLFKVLPLFRIHTSITGCKINNILPNRIQQKASIALLETDFDDGQNP